MGDIPGRMRLAEDDEGMLITYRWFKAKYLLTLLLTPVFAYFLVRSTYVAGDFEDLQVPAALVLIVALLVVYYSLARLLNSTRLRVTEDRILVQNGPVPLLRNRELQKTDVVQLYVTRHSVGHRYYMAVTRYQVMALLRDRDELTLVRGLASAEQGWFIEKKIESFFNIMDIPMSGEVDKS